ncbi:hypothetical protein GCM10022232_68160 [Streptomyces plumbiresistens]|uniref:Uncharacterized protein n=1 Tax=Streptomyces plumbiresistens TaxID=511811 RepID=A0ABP7SRF1_9ACTN
MAHEATQAAAHTCRRSRQGPAGQPGRHDRALGSGAEHERDAGAEPCLGGARGRNPAWAVQGGRACRGCTVAAPPGVQGRPAVQGAEPAVQPRMGCRDAAPRGAQGAKARVGRRGRAPCGVQGRSPAWGAGAQPRLGCRGRSASQGPRAHQPEAKGGP